MYLQTYLSKWLLFWLASLANELFTSYSGMDFLSLSHKKARSWRHPKMGLMTGGMKMGHFKRRYTVLARRTLEHFSRKTLTRHTLLSHEEGTGWSIYSAYNEVHGLLKVQHQVCTRDPKVTHRKPKAELLILLEGGMCWQLPARAKSVVLDGSGGLALKGPDWLRLGLVLGPRQRIWVSRDRDPAV